MIIENSFSFLPQPCRRFKIPSSENQSDRTANRQNNKRHNNILDDELRDNGENNMPKSLVIES